MAKIYLPKPLSLGTRNIVSFPIKFEFPHQNSVHINLATLCELGR